MTFVSLLLFYTSLCDVLEVLIWQYFVQFMYYTDYAQI